MTAECVSHGSINEGTTVLNTQRGFVTIETESAIVSENSFKDNDYPCLIDTQLQNYQKHYVQGIPLPKGVINKPNTVMDNECPACGMCIRWKIVEKEASPREISCIRFGKVGPGKFSLNGTARNGCSNLHLSIGEIGRTDKKPTGEKGDCILASTSNRLLVGIKNGEHKYSKTPGVGCSGYCFGCANTFSFSASVDRLEPIPPFPPKESSEKNTWI